MRCLSLQPIVVIIIIIIIIIQSSKVQVSKI